MGWTADLFWFIIVRHHQRRDLRTGTKARDMNYFIIQFIQLGISSVIKHMIMEYHLPEKSFKSSKQKPETKKQPEEVYLEQQTDIGIEYAKFSVA